MSTEQRSTDPRFDVWWRDKGHPGYNVGALNEAFKEIARKAWDAALAGHECPDIEQQQNAALAAAKEFGW